MYLVYEYHEVAHNIRMSQNSIPHGKTETEDGWLVRGKRFIVIFFYRCRRITGKQTNTIRIIININVQIIHFVSENKILEKIMK